METENLKNHLNNKALSVYAFDEIDSTNSEAKRLLNKGIETPALIITDGQTAGRGRMGRDFYSPKSTGLYFSYVYTPEKSVAEDLVVTSAAAVAVCRAIRQITGQTAGIKWVNDVYLDGKKICGILTEAVTTVHGAAKQSVIVGIGINVSTNKFPSDLTVKAGSLGITNIDRGVLAAAVVNHLETLIKELPERTFAADYRKLSLVVGKSIVYSKNGVETAAQAVAITDDGGLVVRHNDGTESTLNTGEISLKIQ